MVIIDAHGNNLRATVRGILVGISKDIITKFAIPTGVPLILKLNKDTKAITQENATILFTN